MNIPSITLSNGIEMPQIGLGTWKSPGTQAGEAVEYALGTAGYTHIDCARIYGNEPEIGRAIKNVLQTGKVKREDLFITSKLWNNNHDPAEVEAACRKSLQDLQIEYLDLYLIHWGVAFAGGREDEPRGHDGKVELGQIGLFETWQAMETLVERGLVRSIGVANYSAAMLADVLSYAKVPPVINQIELHPYNTQQELVEYCRYRSVAVTAYSPLGNRSRLQAGDPSLLEDETVLSIAGQLQKTPAQVVLRWALQRGTVAIPKSITPARIDENLAVFDFSLDETQIHQLDGLNRNKRFVNPSENWGIPYFA